FFFHSPAPPPDLHSFPTRRSSDLLLLGFPESAEFLRPGAAVNLAEEFGQVIGVAGQGADRRLREVRVTTQPASGYAYAHEHVLRSEEHTSELQSRRDLVCRLLLEK